MKGITPSPKDKNKKSDNNNGGPPPVRPILPPFIDPRPPLPPPSRGPGPSGFNAFQPSPPDPFPFRGIFDPSPPPPAPFLNNFGHLKFGAQHSIFNRPNVSSQPTLNLFGSQRATLTRQKEYIAPKDDVSIQIDDTNYDLPE